MNSSLLKKITMPLHVKEGGRSAALDVLQSNHSLSNNPYLPCLFFFPIPLAYLKTPTALEAQVPSLGQNHKWRKYKDTFIVSVNRALWIENSSNFLSCRYKHMSN
ncbi:hypothetical protein ILYODFUR_019774 [Ilyodon furcidens]|uniref:Uncharacterized protein n=1 Tax=Ilyodon furcidens TaxID=33524 RepID=A0ABV0T0R0_9TELE